MSAVLITTYPPFRNRSSPVPQLKCVGGSASGRFTPQVVQCYNRGWDGQDVQWECKTDMEGDFRFGSVEVVCEGFDYPDDPYILKGSCGMEYTLDYTREGEFVLFGVWQNCWVFLLFFYLVAASAAVSLVITAAGSHFCSYSIGLDAALAACSALPIVVAGEGRCSCFFPGFFFKKRLFLLFTGQERSRHHDYYGDSSSSHSSYHDSGSHYSKRSSHSDQWGGLKDLILLVRLGKQSILFFCKH